MENFRESFREEGDYHQLIKGDHGRIRSEDTKQLVLYGSRTDDTTGKEIIVRSLNHDQNKDLDRSRICKVCGKRFQSGQALGGHVSIHSPPRLGPQKMNNKFKPTNQQQVLQYYLSGDNKLSCPVCNKSFPSSKSLYGHMGCHRRRVVSSPSSSSSSSTESDDDYIDHIEREQDYGRVINYLPSWAKKDRRGRTSATSSYSRSSTLIADQTPIYNIDLANNYCKFPSSKKVKLLDGFKHGRHVCNICHKTFPTGQALGGHKRAHYSNEAEPVQEAPAEAKIKVASTDDHEDGETIDPVMDIEPMALMQLAQEAVHHASRGMLDFDLNEPPPEDDE